jgi:hypothetical protein
MNSSKRLWIYVSIILAVISISVGWQRGSAQSEDAQYFPSTGHWVRDEFLIRYHEISNPSVIYGAPITERFFDPFTELEVQYFEKVRFELHPNSPNGLQVKLSPLGDYLYQQEPTLSSPVNAPACRTFVQTGFSVCYAFLDFFEANGGGAQFGYPISGFEIHDGWIVQYFQNMRFEWHPENKTGERVTISNLGYRYFFDHREDPTLLNSVPRDEIPELPILDLRTHAFAGSAVLPLDGTQTLYFIVQDQYHNPVTDADVDFTLIFPDGSTKEFKTGKTDSSGISTLSFKLDSNTPGTVNVLVEVSFDNGALTAKTRTSFSLWW